MKHRGVLAARALVPALALAVTAQCRRAEVATADSTPAASRTAPAVPQPAGAPSPTSAVEAAAGRPTPSRGAWVDGTIYRFRLEDVRSCSAPGPDGAARIGAVVRVTSNIDELFVAPRDFKLETGGVILDSVVAPTAAARCAPPLAPRALRAGKTADGVVVFDIPAGFNPEQRPVRIIYQPTRWGGARRVEAVLPPLQSSTPAPAPRI